MIVRIDTDARIVEVDGDGADEARTIAFADPAAFEIVSKAWLQVGWDLKHVYRYTWLGRPIIQLPEDIVRLQEVVVSVKPDVIIETGVAHGGSLILFASLCELLGNGRVIGVERDLRPHNRAAIATHPLAHRVTIVEGDSSEEATLARVNEVLGSPERVLVFLDSSHSKQHVLSELRLFAPLVSVGSYVVVADGIIEELASAPRSTPSWGWDNPLSAIETFLAERDDFVQADPPRPFQEGEVESDITYWPGGWLRRIR